MDILIKNIELPIVGRLVLAICPDGVVYKYTGDKNKYGIDSVQEYLTKSPAIPVPEHGDLIDRDAVATAMRDYLLNHFGERLDEDLSNAIYALIAESAVVLERT